VKELAQLLSQMRTAGVIESYALFGAMAQMRYTEAVATVDADVLVTLPRPGRIDALSGIYEFCAGKGYQPQGESIQVGAWPVQFVPVFSALTREAVEHAETADFEGVPIRVLSADYLAVIALSTGRAKDYARILALLESESVTPEAIERLAGCHALGQAWLGFRTRFLNE
jgi:hypothetical protein